MTDHEKLVEIQEQIEKEAPSYERMKKDNAMYYLLAAADTEEGKLCQELIIPLYELDTEFLKNTLKDLGYSPKYEEAFNHFFDTTCYNIKLY